MKIGFFGGSFNPVTNAHINLALNIIEKYSFDKIVFVPVGNYYEKKGLIDEKHRFNMLKLATEKYENIEVSDIELGQKSVFYATDIFSILKQKYSNDNIYFIMGADNLYSMILWKDFENIVKDYKYIVIERGILNCQNLIQANETFKKYNTNFLPIENKQYSNNSSTYVRKAIENGQVENIEEYINPEVYRYIKQNELYKTYYY